MLVKHPFVSGWTLAGVVIVALNGCSLKDYSYLGAGSKMETDSTTDGPTEKEAGVSTTETGTDTGAGASADDASVGHDADVDSGVSASPETGAETTSEATSTSSGPEAGTSSETSSSETTTTTTTATETAPVVVDPDNLIANASFENGIPVGWSAIGSAKLTSVSSAAHTGAKSIECTMRTQDWEGPAVNVIKLLEPGKTYTITGWVRTNSEGIARIGVTAKYSCLTDAGIGEDTYVPINSTYTGSEWSQISGTYSVPDCELVTLVLYFEGPAPGEIFFLDDVSVKLVP